MIEAVDQYGEVVRLKGEHPRRELLAALDAKTARPMYRDTASNETLQVGYVVYDRHASLERWFTLYTVKPWVRVR